MAWPLSQDYNEAIQSAKANFADSDLRRGTAAVNPLGLPMPFSGNFADVYKVECPDGSRWAVKCFTRQVPHLRERYLEISRYLRQAKLPFTVDFSYLVEGIRIGGRWYPVLKMQWVEGLTFNQFVSQFLDKPSMLEALLRLWTRMAIYLRVSGAAHGDLQHGNVLLVPGANANSLALKLIDYDGMYVPALAGSKSGEVGHPSYQHPQRMREATYSLEVDRFPLLLIATALSALRVRGRALWEKYDNADNLLFREADLRDPARSELFRDLSRVDDPATAALTTAVRTALKAKLEAAPLLEEVLADGRPEPLRAPAAAAPIPVAQMVAPAVAPGAVQAVSDAGIWDFSESIVDVSASAPTRTRAKRKPAGTKRAGLPVAVWIGAAAAAAFVVLGGGAWFWGKPVVNNNPIPPDVTTEPKDRPRENVEIAVTPMPGFAAAEKIGEVRRYELDQADEHGEVCLAALTPDNTRLVRVFGKADTGKEQACCLCLDPTGRYAALGMLSGVIEIWDLKDLKKKKTLPDRRPPRAERGVAAVAFAPDGTRLLAAGPDAEVHLWDVEKGTEVGVLKAHDEKVGLSTAVACSPDGLHYLIGTGSGIVRVIRADTYQKVARFAGPTSATQCLAVAPDSRHAVSGSADGTVSFWNLHDGWALVAFNRHKGPVTSVAVSPDGRRVLSGGEDQVIRLWELESGQVADKLSGHKYPVTSVGFFKDGLHAFSCGKDKTAVVWRLPPPNAPPPPPIVAAPADKNPKRPGQRLPVPNAAEIAAAEMEFNKAFQADLADQDPFHLQRLISSWKEAATDESKKSAAYQFVLLRESRDLAVKCGTYWQALAAVEDIARFYAVDVWEWKADALERINAKAAIATDLSLGINTDPKVFHQKFAVYVLSVADEAADEDGYSAAERLVKVAEPSAAKSGSPKLKAQVSQRLTELVELRKAYDRVVPDALHTLAERSDDEGANLDIGKFYALDKGDWDRALPRLTLGSAKSDLDAILKDLAKSDLECGPDADAMAELGRRYDKHADKYKDGPAKAHLQWRACYWYERAEGVYSKGSSSRLITANWRAGIEKNLPAAQPHVLYAGYGNSTSWTGGLEKTVRRELVLGSILGRTTLTFRKGVPAAFEIAFPPREIGTLVIAYRYHGRVRLSTTGDFETVHIPPLPGFVDESQPARPKPGQELTILYARYGVGSSYKDVAEKVQTAVERKILKAKLSDLDLGDPAPGKQLIIVYRYAGRVYFDKVDEGSTINLDPPRAEP
jgi:hypothetical protein